MNTLLYSILLYSREPTDNISWKCDSVSSCLWGQGRQKRKKHVLFKARVKGLLKGTSEGYNEGHVIFCALTRLGWLEESSCWVTHRERLRNTTPPTSNIITLDLLVWHNRPVCIINAAKHFQHFYTTIILQNLKMLLHVWKKICLSIE